MALKVISTLVILYICSGNICSKAKAMVSISREEDLELERQLKILNKPPIKTIQTKVGDIIDCVDINKQPALDHPSLKNHKVQLRPSSFPAMAGMPKTSSGAKSLRLTSTREACPSGTVPIKRTTKEDLIRVRSLSISNIGQHASNPSDKHLAVVRMREDMKYYGATASISVYNLSVAQDQTSSANIWIQDGPPEETSFITAGWMISPAVNGDGLTRLFSYWTGGSTNNTGCFNNLCPGFVQTNKEVTLNQDLSQTSTYGGQQYTVKYLIYQDRQTGNWWFVIGMENIVVGYWPKEIFSYLKDGAKLVAYGGFTKAGNDGISPPMGNGHMPDGHYKDTCYFRQVRFIDENNGSVIPAYDRGDEYVDSPNCNYGLKNDKNWGSQLMGYAFMFGGPGGKC